MKDNQQTSLQEKKIMLFEKDMKDLNSFEEKIKALFITEFEEKLSTILLVKETEFMSKFNLWITLVIEDMYSQDALNNRSLQTIMKKCEKYIYEKFYVTNSQILSKAIKDYENNPSKGLFLTHFKRHCRKTNEFASHTCHGKFIQISSNYIQGVGLSKSSLENKKYYENITHLVCIGCKKSYLSNSINLYCHDCNTEYYSTVLQPDENTELVPATWDKYHCSAIINDTMKCIKCKNIFYLNIKENMLFCKNCEFETDPMDILWKCFICNNDFKTGAKIYNSMEFKIVKIAIKEALLFKDLAFPSLVPCCNYNIEKTLFYHKKDCSGSLYRGEMKGETIIVCEKCKMMNFESKFIWTCPKCNTKFKNDNEVLNTENDNNNTNNNKFHQKKNSLDFSQKKININANVDEEKIEPKLKIRNSISGKFISNNIAYSANKRHSATNDGNISNKKTNDFQLESKDVLVDEKGKNLFIKKNTMKYLNFSEKEITSIREFSKENKEKDKFNFLESRKKSDNSILGLEKTKIKLNEIGQQIKGNNNIINISIKNVNIISNITPTVDEKKSPKLEVKNESPYKVLGRLNSLGKSPSPSRNIERLDRKTESTQTKFIIDKKSNILSTFDFDNFQINQQIGEGTYGQIYLVSDKKGIKYALKKLITNNEEEIGFHLDEFNLVNSCKHDNILSLKGYYKKKLDETTFVLYVLMELATNDWDKEIKTRITNKKFYTEKELIDIVKQIVNGLAFLQYNQISHRDIKPQNVLVFPNNAYKLADFGEAKEAKASKEMNTLRGTELYMSPVLFEGLKNNKNDINHNPYKSDVFSLAFCLIYAATLTYNPIYDLRRVNDNKNISIIINRYFSGKFSTNFITLLLKMLDLNESKRVDFLELENYLNDTF